MKRFLFGLALAGAPLMAQTVTLLNTANAALDDPTYGADFVAGDTFSLSIAGAAANSPVTLLETQNGVSTTGGVPYYFGQTDAGGSFQLTGTETSAYIAEYTEQRYVLTVSSVSPAAFKSPCTTSSYGISVDVKYNITSQNGLNVASSTIDLEPEDDYFYDGTQYHGDVGPVAGYNNSAQYAANDGTFHDVPLGVCGNVSFSGLTDYQAISVYIGNHRMKCAPPRGSWHRVQARVMVR